METRITEDQIRKSFLPYMHPFWGTVCLYSTEGLTEETYNCDNMHLFTALYFRVLKSQGFYPSTLELSRYFEFLRQCSIKPGLIDRFPGRDTDISQDEIIGACSVFTTTAVQIEQYGRENFWSYNLVLPKYFNFHTFLGRFPTFVYFVKSAANKFTGLWSIPFLFGFVCSALTSHGETSGKQLAYLQCQVVRKNFTGRIAVWIWTKIMNKRYPGGYRELAKIYFPKGHPFTIYAADNWQ